MFHFLIRAGVDKTQKDMCHRTPYNVAEKANRKEILKVNPNILKIQYFKRKRMILSRVRSKVKAFSSFSKKCKLKKQKTIIGYKPMTFEDYKKWKERSENWAVRGARKAGLVRFKTSSSSGRRNSRVLNRKQRKSILTKSLYSGNFGIAS